MANSLLTINMITREAVRLFKNSNAFIGAINTQYDDQFARSGAKIGTQLRVRLPNDYTVRSGPAASVQDTSEQQITFTLATQKGVDVSFNSVDRTMSLDDYSERVLAPMMNNLIGQVAVDGMLTTEGANSQGGFCNYVANVDGAGNTLHPNAQTFLFSQAALDDNSVDRMGRKLVNDPWTDASTVSTLSGLFNPATRISQQFNDGSMKNALGYDWMVDQTIIKHTAGTFTSGTVNGAGQTGTTLVLNAITGTLLRGDIITIANVNAVNRVTKQTTGKLRQFVVVTSVASGATGVTVYPAIIPPILGQAQQYQTVDSSPANGAAISLAHKAGETVRRSVAFHPQAITMATADLEIPKGVHEAARAVYDGVSLRMVTAYNIGTDQYITRTDVLYGFLAVRAEWGAIVADSIN